MMAHKRLSLQQALLALDNDDFSDDNTGGMSTDEEEDLDRQLGLTDGVSRQVFYVFFRPFLVSRSYICCAVCVSQTGLKSLVFLLYILKYAF